MKKIVLFLIAITSFLSCSLDDDGPTYTYSVLPVDSYVVPASFTLGKTYEIKLKYQNYLYFIELAIYTYQLV